MAAAVLMAVAAAMAVALMAAALQAGALEAERTSSSLRLARPVAPLVDPVAKVLAAWELVNRAAAPVLATWDRTQRPEVD